MSDSSFFTLEQYKLQRVYREDKRKQYLRKFQTLKTKFQEPPRQPAANLSKQIQKQTTSNIQPQSPLDQQNLKLRAELEQIEKEEREKLIYFKQQIANVKGKYIERIKKISQDAKLVRDNNDLKIAKLGEQINAANKKNEEIESVNSELATEISQSVQMMDKYSTEIKNQYGTKLSDFEEIFKNSNQKIEAMEAQMNEEEFVQNTLNNEELMTSLRENSEKGGEDIDKIISDYKELLEGKKEILQQISSNNTMKDKEIKKMAELQGKLKVIFEKLTQEKKIYLAENNKMAEELMQVKTLLMTSMGEGAA